MNKLGVLILFCIAGTARAQQQQECYRFPIGPATWKIACQEKNAASPSPTAQPGASPQDDKQPPVTLGVDVTQTAELRRSVIRMSKGKNREVWVMPKTKLFLTEDPGGTATFASDMVGFGDPFDPACFEWVKSGALVSPEPVSYRGSRCYHYKGSLFIPQLNGPPLEIPCEAWIQADTLLPVVFRRGDLFGIFTFGAPPEGPLVMPDKFKKRLDYHKAVMGYD